MGSNSDSKALLVLVLNAGSSSLKYGLFSVESLKMAKLIASGLVERICQPGGCIKHKVGDAETEMEADFQNHGEALQRVLALLTDSRTGVISDPADIKCVGHRVVHGGTFKEAAVINEAVEASIEEACQLAPLHNPPNLLGIRTARSMFEAPQVAVFDTAFHMTIPVETYSYALPKDLAEKHGIRRYGFHGTSYSYACKRAAAMLGRPLSDLNIIACHLGSGASMACIKSGHCIDTTMGMTPLEGLVMGTRSGDVDAGVILHLAKAEGMDIKEFSNLLNKQSGLKGICGVADMRSISLGIEQGDPDAKLARALFIARIRKYFGSYLVQLGGKVDAVVFTGGIGENDEGVRREVCVGLSGFGIEIDNDRNSSGTAICRSVGAALVNSPFSRSSIIVVRADEEGEIALQSVAAAKLITEEQKSTGMKVRKGVATGSTGRVYLAPLSAGVGTTTSAIGLMGVLMGAGKLDPHWVAPFFPFEDDSGTFCTLGDDHSQDPVVSLIQTVTHAESVPRDELVGVKLSHALQMMEDGNDHDLLDVIIEKYQALEARGFDFIMVMGHPAVGMTWHRKIATALGLDFVAIGGVPESTKPDQVKDEVYKSLNAVGTSVKVKGVILNKLPVETDRVELAASLKRHHYPPIALIPHSKVMAEVSPAEIAVALGAKVRFGHKALERVPMRNMLVASLHVEALLDKIRQRGPGSFIVVHSQRGDILLGIMTAIQSRGFPSVSGVLMTGGGQMSTSVESILDSIEQAEGVPFPVLNVNDDTYNAASNIVNMPRKLAASGTRKVDTAIGMFEKFADKELVYGLVTPLDSSAKREVRSVSPSLFEFQLKAAARAFRQRIVLPEGNDSRVVTAASELAERGLCKVIILGDESEVSSLAQRLQVDISKATIINPATYHGLTGMAQDLHERRKSKGLTYEAALAELQNNPNMFGTMMMAMDMADGMVSGACHTTADTMRPALQVIKCAPGVSLVSSIFFMLLSSGVKVFGDCAIMENPTSDNLASIAYASALTAKQFGIEPKIAMLSYATGDSNSGPMITKVREATAMVKEKFPEIADVVDGPIQFDAAVDPEIAAVKYKGNPGPVAGQANVCIFPDLNAGNNAYKAVQQASGCVAIGPVMQGLRLPVNDLSRGCTVEDVIQTAIVTCVQAINAKGTPLMTSKSFADLHLKISAVDSHPLVSADFDDDTTKPEI
mmetsp:Transcript_39465/g.111858  ORF Transcript_39465/g.111858 Transcript_39465/m.111858 type:complete len:1193 (-) Transcript_39465:2677-6255(-)